MAARIDHTTTSGTFSLDGQTFDVDNNAWVVGDDTECVVIDVPHDVEAIKQLIAGRTVLAILATHAHDDHVRKAPELAAEVGAPIFLHPDDQELWRLTHPDREPERTLADRQVIGVAGTGLQVLHTPGHAPGSVCLYSADLGTVFTGDTLFAGGPGATGRSYSDFNVLVESIRDRLLTLPEVTTVHPGHGESTTVGEVLPQFEDWVARGY
ncbi:MBL fold metallo-hydrolase [Saccharopolyspora gloriosae]|uniref:MBL fold metallo-hydrolase n=1 Tax=Saccharopolyspora gloriosae TaxID=455344 RepID=UPI001FB72B08|nr:MBL fold metallo-hydrolase [Saccharopolyspora gloriosae]